MKEKIKILTKIANSLGLSKGLKSYDKLYGRSINTFGRSDASMWFLTISLTDDNKCCGIEINTTYFNHTDQTNLINKHCSFENQMELEDVLKLLKENGY